MLNTIERIISYLLGGILGIVFGLLLLKLNYFSVLTIVPLGFVLIPAALFGILVAIVYIGSREEKHLRASNKVRDETVALITHEMRTGLTATGWSIEHILDHYKGRLEPHDVKMLQDSVASIKTTVMHSVNLLDISLLEIDKLSIAREWVSLEKVEEMVHETIEKFKFGAEKEGIKLTSAVNLDHTKQIEVDMLRLRIILESLIENAFQYIRPDDRKIHVTVSNDQTTLNITVSDTGIGIPIVEQEKIFEVFYRASNARKKLSTGSGIGLYLCNEYIKAHHGSIWFTSKENQGTTFNISIPLKSSANINEFLEKM